MMLFTEQDRRVRLHDCSSGEESAPHDVLDDERIQIVLEYAAQAGAMKDRLEFLGFTLPVVRQLFRDGISERLEGLNQQESNDPWRMGRPPSEQQWQREFVAREEALLRSLTFDEWLSAFAFIWGRRLHRDSGYWFGDFASAAEPVEQLPELVKYMLSRIDEGLFGFPAYDFRPFLRAILEVIPTDAEVVYDLSELLADDYLSLDEDLCLWARHTMAEEFVQNHKIVVLTEGSSDAAAIVRALRIHYPHLSEYYSFMDFEGARVAGGAGALVGTLKAFVGAGIVNRIVAMFDNDTAAQAALRGLRDVRLPDSVRVLQYPPLALARSYPTIGPQGITEMDVNGLAGSLELYFGVDVLTREDGTLTPVQWRGYDDALGRYQGELLAKGELQRRFFEKLKRCEENLELVDACDWTGMRAILESLRTAFH